MDTEMQGHTETTYDKQAGSSRFRMILLVIGVVLLAINLRACITGVGPLVATIRGATGISNVSISLLTTLPLIAFGLISPLAPRLGRRWGMEWMLLVSAIGLAAGILLRSVPMVSLLFLGTALLGAAIAISNVLLPALIKRDFPRHIGLMTGLYSTLVSASGAIADGVSIPLAQGSSLGWRGSLAFWALPVVLTALLWLPLLRPRPTAGVTAAADRSVRGVWRSPLAWQVTFFMGLQSLTFYAMVAWFPVIFQDDGLSPANAGWVLALLQLFGVIGSFVTPLLAGRMRSQRLLVAIAIAMGLIAYVGILSGAIGLIVLWSVLLGLASGAYLSLALLFFILRTPHTRASAELSGMAQSIGYLLAATGPLIFGWLHDLTHGWTMPMLFLMAVVLVIFGVGMGAGRDVTVELAEDSAAQSAAQALENSAP